MMNTDHLGQSGGLQRSFRVQDFATPGMISRERSFVRPQSHHHPFNNHHQVRDGGKRRSMIVTTNNRGKPTMEIYRPPSVRVDGIQQNKLNVHAKEFTMLKQNELQNSRSQMSLSQMGVGIPLHHSKSSGNILHQLGAQQQHQAAAAAAAALARPALPPLYHHQAIPLISSQSSGNILHSAPRVHFKLPQQMSQMSPQNHQLVHQEKKRSPPANAFLPRQTVQRAPFISPNSNQQHLPLPQQTYALKRSKSLTSADTLASGMAALGLTADAADLGAFPQEIQDNLEKASQDPNQLSARILMELVGHIMRRAVESPRYALPAARQCIAIIERERTETFLESLLNTCQQWYRDRDKLLNVMMGGGRPRLMAFISLLLELFCQLRRRCSNQSGQQHPAASAITPPARTLLTLICKCCEECIRAPVPSASDTENLFFVLTYIGRDLETHLPGDLENLLAAVRDAFLNTSAGPSITKTLLQLIELHASHWQLPGGAVLYYYPSSK